MNKYNKIYFWVPLIVALALTAGIGIGVSMNHTGGRSATEKKFGTILELIRNDYVDRVDIDSLLEETLPELLSNLDPHSVYIPAESLQAVNEDLDGSFGGIGISFMINNDTIKVIEVIPGGPAEKIGILAGDRIVTIDDENFTGEELNNEKVMATLRGERDTRVTLGIKRNTSKKLLNYEVTRGDIPVTSIDAAYIASPEVGYIKINKFGRTTFDEFWQSMQELKRAGAHDFIIDLRGNTGGFMEMAIRIANEFLPAHSPIVSTRGRDGKNDSVLFSDGSGAFQDSELVIILDEFSASASEILAGAIQDNDRGLIVGRRSFGKGLIQSQSLLPDSSAIRLTIARYYTPSGRSIQKDYSDAVSYSNDLINRFNHGESFSADSIKLNTDMEYLTLHGRKVFGGGGIMPDIFIPNDTSGISSYYIKVANAGLLQKFAFEYCDNNREKLSEASDIPQLLSLLPADDALLYQFVRYAVSNGIPAQWYYINISRDLIVNQLKALIARDTLGYGAYFEIINVSDTNVERAIKEILEGNTRVPVGIGASESINDRN